MTKLEQIEQSVEQLSAEELAKFRAWFRDYQAKLFDDAIERDAAAGKLDWLADEALAEHKAGRARRLP